MGELGMRKLGGAKFNLEDYIALGRNSGDFTTKSNGGWDLIPFTVNTPSVACDADSLFFLLVFPSGFPTFVLPDLVYANAEKPERTLQITRKSTYGFQVMFKNNSTTNWSDNFETYAIAPKK